MITKLDKGFFSVTAYEGDIWERVPERINFNVPGIQLKYGATSTTKRLQLAITLYWLVLLLSIPSAIVGLTGWRLRRRVIWRIEGRCARCGYDLRGITERCPECGTSVTPVQSKSQF